jgi:hypothetical protein
MCNNYAMRSTQNVADSGEDPRIGHYSDPPMLVLASLANGPKHGHAMIDDITGLCGTRLGPERFMGLLLVWKNRVGSNRSYLRSVGSLIALPRRACVYCAQS